MKKLILDLTESEKQRILQMHENASRIERGLFYEQTAPAPAIPPKSKTPFTLDMRLEEEGSYTANSADPTAFIDKMLNNILAKINENPEAKTLLTEKKLVVKGLYVLASSSNRWGTKQTSYDRTRSSSPPHDFSSIRKVKTFSGDSDNKLYQLNLDLANNRAKNFLPKMIAKLKAKGIGLSENTIQKSSGVVTYTNGKLDKDSGLPYKGQFVQIYLALGNKVDVDTFRVNITKLDDIKEGFVLKGYYNCFGKNSIGRDATSTPNVYLPMCQPVINKYASTQQANMLIKTLGSFEIKWNPNVINEPFDEPIRRWTFNWIRNSAGRVIIKDVSVLNINKVQGKWVPPGLFAPGNVSPSDPQLVYMMNLGGAGLWDKFVRPYLS